MTLMADSSSKPTSSILDPTAASRAGSLWSRLAHRAADPLTEREARAWIQKWRRLAQVEGVELDRRLSWDGWTVDSVVDALAWEGMPLLPPDWPSKLDQWINSARTWKRAPAKGDTLPFQDLLGPLARRAGAGLAAPSVGPGGKLDMERLLTRRLGELAAPTLQAELDRRGGEFKGYADFVCRQSAVWPRIFSRRPVLSRLMVESAGRWKGSLAEMLKRLDKDRPRLRARFNQGHALGRLESLEAAGDEHLGGRAVYVLGFESGRRLVYKPRDLSPEAAWCRLLQWFNRRRANPFAEVAALCRDGYGWMRHVPPQPISDAHNYYRSAGELSCLVYLLGGRDFHFENLIVSGGRPVLVDLETVLQPLFREDALDGSGNFPSGTVLETGLLPRWICLRPRRPVDLSGLGCVESQNSGFWKLKWTRVNSDGMRARTTYWRIQPSENVPRRGRQVFPPGDFSDAVLHGFESAYRDIQRVRSLLLSSRGPMQRFRKLPIRVLLRNSASYAETLRRSLHGVCLAHGIRRSLTIDRIAAKWRGPADPPLLWPAAAAEIEALENLDIPVFNAKAESRDLSLPGGGVVPGCFRISAFENAELRLSQMGEEDLKAQLGLIDCALRRHRLARREGRRLGPLLAWMLQNQEEGL